MMNRVMNSDNPMRIWLGGSCGVPIAWRRNEKPMMMRVNDVTDRMMDRGRPSTRDGL